MIGDPTICLGDKYVGGKSKETTGCLIYIIRLYLGKPIDLSNVISMKDKKSK